MKVSEIAIFVLAGGMGTRLRTVVADRPKVMADIGGRPFLDFILDYLRSQGAEEVTLLTGYLGSMISSHYGSSYRSISLTYSQEPSPLGTGGAVKLALKQSVGTHKACMVLNGDTYFPANLKRLLGKCEFSSNYVLTTQVADVSRFGSLGVSHETGKVTAFMEKGASGQGLINSGTYILDPSTILSFQGSSFSLEQDILPVLVSREMLLSVRDPACFIDIGIPTDYASFQSFVKKL